MTATQLAPSAVSLAQIGAQLDAVLRSKPDIAALAIRSAAPGAWPDSLSRNQRRFRLRWCESDLALREALTDLDDSDSDGLILLTPLDDTAVPPDVLSRLARARIYQPKGWETLRQWFGVTAADARLRQFDWMPEVLIETAASQPFTPLPGGYLDLDTAWREVMARCLGLAEAHPDVIALLHWARSPDATARIGRLPVKAREDALAWMAKHAGEAGPLVIGCIKSSHGADATALGLVCDVVFDDDAQGVTELAQAAVRLERFVGDQHLPRSAARHWAAQTALLLEHMPGDEAAPILERADQLMRDLRADDHAHRSIWLPAGLDQRLRAFADALVAHLEAPSNTSACEIERQATGVFAHRLGQHQPLRMEAVRMALRLARWLANAPTVATNVDAQLQWQATEGAFVDRARYRLQGGDEQPDLSAAYARLRTAVAERQAAQNAHFARLLAPHLREARPLGPMVLPVESVLHNLVGPLAGTHPVLLLVVDGLSLSIFRELFDRPARYGWTELQRADGEHPLIGLAAFPTITETSRASLLCGRITAGVATNERTAFETHPALQGKLPARLFHKGQLSMDGGLSDAVRAAIADPLHKVVGVVYNAVDDQLSGSDQLNPQWSLETLRLMLPLLREARDARRLLVVTADHGHVLEDGSKAVPDGVNDRWRRGTQAKHPQEVVLQGPRVRTPDGENSVICLWHDAARYTSRKNGYHGGASLAEAVVPLSLFTPTGISVAGWQPAPPQQPLWWEAPVVPPSASIATARESAGRAARKPGPRGSVRSNKNSSKPGTTPGTSPTDDRHQHGLFSPTELPLPAEAMGTPGASIRPATDPAVSDWIGLLLASPAYQAQRQLAARVALPDETMRQLLMALDERGGRLTRTALAHRLAIAEMRLAGMLSAARRVLNIDQSRVLDVDEASATVTLDRKLLQAQFHLTGDGGKP